MTCGIIAPQLGIEPVSLSLQGGFFSFKLYLFAFTFGCAASLLLHTGFPCGREQGLLLQWRTASRPGGFSRQARGLYSAGSVVWCTGVVVLRHVGSSCTQD